MSDYRTATTSFEAELCFADEPRKQRGTVFLPPRSQHARAMRPEERLNEDEPFFPFLPDGEKHAILVSKRHLAALLVSNEEYERFTLQGVSADVERSVTIVCTHETYKGTLSFDAPRERRRVQDALNAKGSFIVLGVGAARAIINKASIRIVKDCEEETLRPAALPPSARHETDVGSSS